MTLAAQVAASPLPARWTTLRPHRTQQAYWRSPHRFNTVPAGRRSGKTELLKRKIVRRAIAAVTPWDPRYFAGAPTRDQAKRIFWDDFKALVPKKLLAERPSESELMIKLINGAEIWVVGMDKPERIEGQPWDGGGLTEIANMKATAWPMNVRPALSDRGGWCDLEGVPEGRNFYFDIDKRAKALMKSLGSASEWGSYSWPSSEILSPEEIAAAKEDLDELTFDQEYNASFINFEGRAYYPFTEELHTSPHLKYDPRSPLILCFDFNVEPGVCAILQEQAMPGQFAMEKSTGGVLVRQQVFGTGIIDEVHIPRNSNTPAVCRAILSNRNGTPTRYAAHPTLVRCYGDATGGARGSAKVEGSDWDLIEAELRPTFGNRLSINYKDANPKERARINAVNSRLLSKSRVVRLMVDGVAAPNVVKDFEGVTLLEGGSGEIDKASAPKLTHVSDAVGYYIDYVFPVSDQTIQKVTLGGL